MDREDIEKEVIEKGLTAQRITKDRILSLIKSEEYYVFPWKCLTVCCLTLENGFQIPGESCCASPENYNKELGEKLAKDDATHKVYQLEAYLLKQRLFEGQK